MSIKISTALQRLQSILPLKANQETCSKELKHIHQTILRSFVKTGRVINKSEIILIDENINSALLTLKQKDLIVLDDHNNIIGAYPLTMDEREHKISVNGFSLNAMCALDALSVSALFQVNTCISSVCRVTQSKVYIEQKNGTVKNLIAAKDIHVGIAWSAAQADSCCANNLCLEMMFLINASIAQKWLLDDADNREVFTLDEAIEFGALFFNPLLN